MWSGINIWWQREKGRSPIPQRQANSTSSDFDASPLKQGLHPSTYNCLTYNCWVGLFENHWSSEKKKVYGEIKVPIRGLTPIFEQVPQLHLTFVFLLLGIKHARLCLAKRTVMRGKWDTSKPPIVQVETKTDKWGLFSFSKDIMKSNRNNGNHLSRELEIIQVSCLRNDWHQIRGQ